MVSSWGLCPHDLFTLPKSSHWGWVRVSIYEFFLEGRGRQKHSVHSNWEWKSRLEVICFRSSKVCLIVFWKVMLRLRSPVLILPLYLFIVNYFFFLSRNLWNLFFVPIILAFHNNVFLFSSVFLGITLVILIWKMIFFSSWKWC